MKEKNFIKNLFQMEIEPRIVDKCLLCARHRHVAASNTRLVYPDGRQETGSLCFECFALNRKRRSDG